MDKDNNPLAAKTWLRLGVSSAALAVLVINLAVVKLDAIGLGLVALAVLPWLSPIVESAKLPGGWEVKFRQVEREQERQRTDLDRLVKFLVENFVSEYELIHLKKLASKDPFPFNRSDAFAAELRRLLSLGLLRRKPDKGIRSLFRTGDDVRNHLEITPRGEQYLNDLATLLHPKS
ncbi:MAG TPA: hypothetical protein VI197_23575 [Polyangiaceae bacterium]